DCEYAALRVHAGAHAMVLFARMIGRDQVLAAVLDPFDRPAKMQRRGTDQNIFGIQFAANAETAADMAFVQLNGFGFSPQHPRDRIAIPVRHLSGAMQLQYVSSLVVTRNGTARFDWYAGVAADRKFKRDDGVAIFKSRFDVAIVFFKDVCLCRKLILVNGRFFGSGNGRPQWLD